MVDNDFTSIGKLASEIQTPVVILQRIIRELKIVPAQRLNGVPYFNAADVARIAGRTQANLRAGS